MKYTVLILLACLISCTRTTTQQYAAYQSATSVIPAKDCSGYTSEMKLLYGYDTVDSGSTFARILAVDHQDGTMSIAILPPSGQTTFPFPESVLSKSFKLIACPENGLSLLNPTSAIGACKVAPINVLGGENNLNPVSNFTADGVYINGTRVHATRNPGTDEGKLLPNFIMLVTAATNSNDTTDVNKIVASAELPYKYCYSTVK